MGESWDQTKLRLRQAFGMDDVSKTVIPKSRYAEAVPDKKISLYEIRKITLPIDSEFPQGKIVITHVTRSEADWWIENKLRAKSYTDDARNNKTLVFYEKFLIGASPRESSIYSNPSRFYLEDGLGSN